MSATTNLGKVSVTPKGAWAITNTYEILDIVASGGSSYLAKQDVPTGVPLTNTSYWIMIAEKGDGGEITSASASISGGYGTPGVSVTAGGTAHERTLAFAFTNLRGEKGETGNGIDSVYKTGTSGLVDTYTILFTDGSTYEFEVNNGTASIDDTLTKSGWAADAKVVGDTKASIDGFYETMGVGVADNLTPYSEDSGASQDIPFIAQGTGCGNGESVVDTGSYCQLKKKLGNTVCVNQLVQNGDFSDGTTGWSASGATLSASNNELTATATSNTTPNLLKEIKITNGHQYMVCFAVYPQETMTAVAFFLDYEGSVSFRVENIAGGSWAYISQIATASATKTAQMTAYFNYNNANNGKVTKFKQFALIDLTLWFGSNDRIPSDLLSHPENWGRYYAGSLAYNAGTLESADGSILTSIHRNIWDEVSESGYIDTANGNNKGSSYTRSKNYVDVIPNTTYYALKGARFFYYDRNKGYLGFVNVTANTTFTTTAECFFIRFCTTVGGETVDGNCISLYYSGESGYDQYYPYSVLAEMDTGSEVLRSAGAVADEKTPDGTITRKVGAVDLGTLTWTKYSVAEGTMFRTNVSNIEQTTDSLNIKCSKYATSTSAGRADKTVSKSGSTRVDIIDNSYSDAASFKTAMSGIYLYYELVAPTTEQGTAFAENIPCDDFGSMYWTQTKGIPQGNEIFYPVDYKASIDTLYNRVEGDMSRIVIDDDLDSYNTKTEDDAKFATLDQIGGTLRNVVAIKANVSFADTASLDLSSLTWETASANGKTYSNVISDIRKGSGSGYGNYIVSTLFTGAEKASMGLLDDGEMSVDTGGRLQICKSAWAGYTATQLTAALKGVLLAYEKASS